jgi:hypothetical protein
MSTPRHVNAWTVVESAEDFASYLLLLSRDAGQAREKRMPWRNDTIPEFLAAFGEIIRPSHYCADFVEVFASPPLNDWRDLAALLFSARGDVTRDEAQPPEPVSDHAGVDDVESLRGFIRWLVDDFRADQADLAKRAAAGSWAHEGRWAHSVIEKWLETWAAWLNDWHLRASAPEPKAERTECLEPITWASVALQLSAARTHE